MSSEYMTLTVPKEYSYVILSIVSTFAVCEWLAIRVVPYRIASGIQTPHAYASPEQIAAAEKASSSSSSSSKDQSSSSSSSSSSTSDAEALYLFNCAQRSQANFVEHHTSVVGAMLIAGLQYPVATAVTGAVWSVSRVLYAIGYTWKGVKDGKGRVIGEGAFLANIVLVGMAGWTGWGMIKGGA